MDAFELKDLVAAGERKKQPYHEFLRNPFMSAGVHHLKAGTKDVQEPHTEDEVYYVTQGYGLIRVGSEDREVRPGSIVFVKAGLEHRFHDIRQDLVMLVFFAPAVGSQGHP